MKNKIFIVLFSLGALVPPSYALAGLTEKYEQLTNPLPSATMYCATAFCDLKSMFLLVIRDILQIIPIAAVVMIVVSGFQMVVSGGNEEKIKQAKRTMLWAVLGLVIAILSFSIVAITQNLIGANI